ncbi:MAG: hypothetical protein Q8S73_08550 [Deltaproteobacteria bacterium]|nr:hypothetical protein [Deltaproteobacteria bacterium]
MRGRALAWRGPLLSLATLVALGLLALAGERAVRRLRPETCAPLAREAVYLERDRALLQPCFRRETVRGVPSLTWARRETEPGAPLTLPLRRTPGVRRVVVLGESSGSLLAAALQRQLGDPACARPVEVLNCAQHSAALEHVGRNLDEALGYEPDAIVLVFGHNLRFRFPVDERAIAARQWRNRSCLLAAIAPQRAEPAMSVVPLDGRLGDLERLLRRMTREARARGVRLVLSAPAANLWFPPGGGDPSAPHLLDARYADATAGPLAAARLLAALPDARRGPAERFREGEAFARAGERGPAREALLRAVDDDPGGGRVHSRTNALLRRFAAGSGVALRDTERALEREVPSGLPGWESFLDTCHLSPEGFDREARAVLALLGDGDGAAARCPPAERPPGFSGLGAVLDGTLRYGAGSTAPSPWHEAAALAVEQWLAAAPAASERALADFVAGLGGRADPGQASRMLVALAEGCARAGRDALAGDLNERARRADEGAPDPWRQRGLFALRRGDREAARAALTRALALAPADLATRRMLDRLSAN